MPTVAVTGVSTTSSVGAIFLYIQQADIVLQVGTLSKLTTPQFVIAPGAFPTGVQAAGSVGTVVPAITIVPNGVSSTSTVGAIHLAIQNPDVILQVGAASNFTTPAFSSSSNDKTVPVAGVSSAGSVGNISVSTANLADVILQRGSASSITTPPFFSGTTVAVTGVQATGSIGTVTPVLSRVDKTVLVTGVQARGDVEGGIIYSDLDLVPDGIQATGQIGTVLIVKSGIVSLPSVVATGTVGSAAPEVRKPVQGVESAGSIGIITLVINSDVKVLILGVGASGAIGQSKTVVSPAPIGVQATGTIGNAGIEVRVLVQGVQATGQIGVTVPSTLKIVSVVGVEAEGRVGLVDISNGGSVTILPEGVEARGSVGNVVVLINTVQVCFPTLWECEPTPTTPAVEDVVAPVSSWIAEDSDAAPIVTEQDSCFTVVEY